MNKDDKKKNEDKDLKEELIEEAEKEELILEADEEIEEIDSEEKNIKEEKIDLEIKKLEAQLRRAVADYQNLEKRIEENRRDWVLSANKSLIMKILPVIDDLLLTQQHIQDQGLDISIQKFLNILKEDGVEIIDTKDKEFDPNTMECVSVQEVDPSKEQLENKVLEEVRKGYIMYDRVLRPAQVIVGGSARKNN